MRTQFPYRLYTQRLFCRRCQRVVGHGVYAREAYSTYGGMNSGIPLLCCCEQCQSVFVAFSQEFSFCSDKTRNGDYTKIYGRNRVAPGNWLYFKGKAKPGFVKSYFQTSEKEIIVLSYDGGPDQKVECPNVVINQEESPDGYRLLPAQSAQTLIGDHVYHAIRNAFGVAVGLVNDGEKDLLAVLLDDGTILFLALPVTSQNLPNPKLAEIVRNRLNQLFPDDARRISVNVGQGVVYLDGLVRNLSVKRALKGCVEALPKVRGCVDFMRVATSSFVSDSVMENDVLSILETPGVRVFDYGVKVEQGKVTVTASCFEDYDLKELEHRITDYPGVQELVFSLNVLPMDAMPNRELCEEIERSLETSSLLSGAKIRVSFVRNKFLLEGRVSSNFQKQLAFLSTMRATKSPSVENKLRIILK